MITVTMYDYDYPELERILNSYIVDSEELQLCSGALPLLRREVQEYGLKIGNNLLIRYIDQVLKPSFAEDMLAKINNETFKTICKEIKEGIRLRC